MDVAELRDIFLFDGVSDAQLAELVAISDEVPFDEGDVLWVHGDSAEHWWVLLEGRLDILRRVEHEESVVGTVDRAGTWFGGFRAWSDSAPYLTTGRGAGPGRVLRTPGPALGELVQTWFPFGVHLIGGLFQTVRNFDAISRQRESLLALGTLAAGLAHELNNPAAAAGRAVEALDATCTALLDSLTQLAEQSLTAEQFMQVEQLRLDLTGRDEVTDPIALADREDVLLDWLDTRDVAEPWRLAPMLAQADADTDYLERAADTVGIATLGPALEWITGTIATRTLLDEVKEATSRVSALVAAVKSYSQLDRASSQSIDLTEGIENTLVMLGRKLGAGITVVRDYDADLPRIEAHPGELNQVWTNLIDNAIDAMEGEGVLRITTRADGDHVVVEVTDNGPGMPAEVQARAFEPFFTTKDVGKGTGLGLDISRRVVVERHHGSLDIEAGPGGTTMRVTLPVHER